jgi:anaerobic selenocysteine-containing dehydrogenase
MTDLDQKTPESLRRPAESARAETGYSFCDGCNQIPRCGIEYTRRGSLITHIKSRTDFGYPNSTLCAKGYAQIQEQYHPDRLKYPLIRTAAKGKPSRWKRISWDEALSLTARRLTSVKKKYGADKVLFMTGDPKEMRPPLQRLAYTFGSPNYGTESSTCYTSITLAGRLLVGRPLMGNPPDDKTGHCFIWGFNPSYSRPVLMKRLLRAKREGIRFFVADPRKTPTVRALDAAHLALRPGTDGALALGMINTVLADHLWDKEFVDEWVHGFDELRSYAQEFPPERVSSITGIPARIIKAAARAFAEGPTTVMLSASPVVHHTNGCQNARAILTLAIITGNLDRPGGLMMPESPVLAPDHSGDPNFCRRSDLLPKIRHLRADLDHFPVWAEMVPEIQINNLPEYVAEGKIRAIVMFGGNAKMWPQPHEYQEALGKQEFSVAVDYFDRPWTHDYVDLLLPAATCLERQASVACFGRKIYVRQPVKPIGEAREDWQIIADLGVALGYSEEFFGGDLNALLDEYLKPAGVKLEHVRNSPGCTITVPRASSPKHGKYASGMLRHDGAPGFETPTGKIEVSSTILSNHGFDPLPVYNGPDSGQTRTSDQTKKYPMILMTGARVPYYTHTKWRNVPWLAELQPEPCVNLNPGDAKKNEISEGDTVHIENEYGSVQMRAHLTEMVPEGMVDVQHGWPEQDVNKLIPRKFDPISGFPPYKAGVCRLRKSNIQKTHR